jgi:hypothetical protein
MCWTPTGFSLALNPAAQQPIIQDFVKEYNMPLIGPKNEDLNKIHSEVNQIVNQRLLLTTLAVTVFGVMIAWLIPRNPPPFGSQVGTFVYVGSILLTIIIFALFLLSHHLTYMLRLFTTYLVQTDSSNWEKDWASYRSNFRYLGYTKPQSMVFLLLGVLAAGFPFLLLAAFPITGEPWPLAVIDGIIGSLYVIFVIGMGLGGWYAKENDIQKRWECLSK